jgi:RNA polymerase sigma factor (sigma-70 family)
VAQQVMARQELELLERAIAGLPQGCREVLLLRKVEQLSHREIAERVGIAVSTVEKQHARALRLLRLALEGSLDA